MGTKLLLYHHGDRIESVLLVALVLAPLEFSVHHCFLFLWLLRWCFPYHSWKMLSSYLVGFLQILIWFGDCKMTQGPCDSVDLSNRVLSTQSDGPLEHGPPKRLFIRGHSPYPDIPVCLTPQLNLWRSEWEAGGLWISLAFCKRQGGAGLARNSRWRWFQNTAAVL